jgi:hypothetical protein
MRCRLERTRGPLAIGAGQHPDALLGRRGEQVLVRKHRARAADQPASVAVGDVHSAGLAAMDDGRRRSYQSYDYDYDQIFGLQLDDQCHRSRARHGVRHHRQSSPDLYAEVRPGDYGWTESLVALNGDTGKLVWAISTCRTTPGTSTQYQRRFLADVMGKDGQTLMVTTDVGRRRSN